MAGPALVLFHACLSSAQADQSISILTCTACSIPFHHRNEVFKIDLHYLQSLFYIMVDPMGDGRLHTLLVNYHHILLPSGEGNILEETISPNLASHHPRSRHRLS